MSAPISPPQTRRLLRRGAWLAFAVVAYELLRALFAAKSESRGLVTPSGGLDTGFVVLGIAVLVMRLAVLFVVPLIAAATAVHTLLEASLRRREPRERAAGSTSDSS